MSAELLSRELSNNIKSYINVTAVCVGEMQICDEKKKFVLEDCIKESFWILATKEDFINSIIVSDSYRYARTYIKIGEKYYGLEEFIVDIETKLRMAPKDPTSILLAEVGLLRKEVSELRNEIRNLK